MLLKRWHFGYFFASTFLFGMMFAELSHFVSPFIERGSFHYSPGMYTAIIPDYFGLVYVSRLIAGNKKIFNSTRRAGIGLDNFRLVRRRQPSKFGSGCGKTVIV